VLSQTDLNVWYTGHTQKNGAVSKVNNKFMSHITRAQHTPSAAATVQVSCALPALRFSCLLRGRGASFKDHHYSGHATPGLGWVWLPCGCVSCDPWCTHWRIVITKWDTWTVVAADGVCCARVRWEIHYLFTFDTAPFFCVCPVYKHTHTHTHTYIYIYIYIYINGSP
jgi:hypothetical protein